ncbi:MFS siderochrome iron transporter MirB [Phlyctema vagabunda]|uniref:MFS siderochrome iron transporter MirB n=1 Tax=Phlyctema vagabunda TaxID=108571 RepID=A0ABR4PBC9_9HELO
MPMTPWMITVFTAAPIVEALVPNQWRLGYGIWAVIVPVSAIPLLLSLYFREKRYTISSPRIEPAARRAKPTLHNMHFDVVGFLMFTTGLAFILFSAANSTPQSYSLASTVVGISGILMLLVFCYYELHVARHPILAMHLARDRTVAGGCLLAIFLFGGFAIYQPYFYSYLVVARNESPSVATNAGLVSLFVSVIAGLMASAVVKFTKRYKWIMIVGVMLRIGSAGLLLVYTTTESSIGQIMAAQVLVGIGTGMGGLIVQVGVQAAVSSRDIATACALYATASSIGNFLGDLISSLLWSSMLLTRLESSLPGTAKGNATAIANSIIVAQSYPMGTPERDAINESYVSVIRALQVTGISVFMLGLLTAFWMRDIDLDREDPIPFDERER